MSKIGYWSAKYDWQSARSIYATILRGIETGRETWSFDPRDYAEDMLNVPAHKVHAGKDRERDHEVKRPHDVFFCAMFQKGECNLDAPHVANVGIDGIERMVHHVCSACLLKDGKKLYHPNGGTGCPHARNS